MIMTTLYLSKRKAELSSLRRLGAVAGRAFHRVTRLVLGD